MSSLTLGLKQKQSLQLSLKMWLPLLQAPNSELENIIKEKSYENPFIDCKSSFESSFGGSGYSGSGVSYGGGDGEFDKRGFIENTDLMKNLGA